MHEAISLHIENLRSHGEPVSPPHGQVEYVEAVWPAPGVWDHGVTRPVASVRERDAFPPCG